jgi:hypothetical protein
MARRNEVELARTLVAEAKILRVQHQTIRQDLLRQRERSRVLIAQACALVARLPTAAEAKLAARGREPNLRKRNKLFYKHRWLISVNMVAALRRAGVDCNIVVPGTRSESACDRLSPEWERASLGFVDRDAFEPNPPADGTLH